MDSLVTPMIVAPTFLLSDSGKGFDPLQVGDWPLYFWTVIVFALLCAILFGKVWRPLMKTVSDRENRIADDIERAEEARREAEEIRNRHRIEMEQAAVQAKAVLEEARERGASLKGELERDARVQAEQIVAKARQQIEAEKIAAMQEIRDHVVDLSMAITRKVVAKDVGREDHLSMAEELIPKVRGA